MYWPSGEKVAEERGPEWCMGSMGSLPSARENRRAVRSAPAEIPNLPSSETAMEETRA